MRSFSLLRQTVAEVERAENKRPRRFLVPHHSRGEAPPVAIYHVVTRIVDRQFVLGAEEKEQLQIVSGLSAGGE